MKGMIMRKLVASLIGVGLALSLAGSAHASSGSCSANPASIGFNDTTTVSITGPANALLVVDAVYPSGYDNQISNVSDANGNLSETYSGHFGPATAGTVKVTVTNHSSSGHPRVAVCSFTVG